MKDIRKIVEDAPRPRSDRSLVAKFAQSDSTKVRIFFCVLFSALTFIILSLYWSRVFDYDALWHARVGLDILKFQRLPTVDIYSHTFAGEPWIAKEWLSQVLLALAYRANGWSGVVLLTNISLTVTAFLLVWLLTAELRPSVAIGTVATAMLLCSIIYLARPHLFTFPLAIVWAHSLFSASSRYRPPSFLLILCIVAWANLHASVVLAFLMLLFAFCDMIERTRFHNVRLIVGWIIFSLLCALATFLQPYGLSAVLIAYDVFVYNPFVAVLQEWQPINFQNDKLFLLPIFSLFLLGLATPFRTSISRSMLTLIAIYFFLEKKRLVYVAFFLPPIVLAADVGRWFPKLSADVWRSEPREGLEAAVLRAFVPLTMAVILVTVATAAVFSAQPRAVPQRFAATEAIEFISENNIQGNVLNSLELGGTLIFHGIKTFIDGRTDQLFLGEFFNDVLRSRLNSDPDILREFLDEHNISWVFLLHTDPRARVMQNLDGWKGVYSDAYTVVFIREGASGATRP